MFALTGFAFFSSMMELNSPAGKPLDLVLLDNGTGDGLQFFSLIVVVVIYLVVLQIRFFFVLICCNFYIIFYQLVVILMYVRFSIQRFISLFLRIALSLSVRIPQSSNAFFGFPTLPVSNLDRSSSSVRSCSRVPTISSLPSSTLVFFVCHLVILKVYIIASTNRKNN